MRRTALFLVFAALVGCGSAEKNDDPKDPVSRMQPQDAPPSEERSAPPLGRPRAPVPPSAMDKRSESLLHDDPPH